MPLKILFLSHKFYPDIGGIEVSSEILARAFSKAGHEVRLLTWSKDSTGKVFPFMVCRNPGKRRLFKEHAWAELIFENNPCLRLSWPGIFFGRPSIISLQTWLFQIGGKIDWQHRLKIQWLNRAQKVIACSNAIRKRCWPDSFVIENPYEKDIFRMLPDVPKTADFVFLGRLVSDKGADLAIQAFHSLFTERDLQKAVPSNLLLTIVGDGPEKERLEGMVSELGLQKNIAFRGSLSGELLVNCLNRHRFILVPSLWEEPFGIVVLEGMACGCLPIVSDGGGLPDAVGNAGLTFRRGDVDALVSCIRKVLENPGLEKQLREAATSHLAAHYPDVISGRYLEIIERAVVNQPSIS